MSMNLRRVALTAVLAAAAVIGGPACAAERAVPVVIELFTSQGCNSCPPADAYLGELAKRPGVLALSLHVDYWDYIGWKDPFAQHAFTLRQRDYSHALAQRYVYTPQMVINGELQGVGSERSDIERLIAKANAQAAAAVARPTIRLTGSDVRIEGGGKMSASVWLAVFDGEQWTAVERGENAGHRLGQYNVVREWRELGRYDGTPVTLKTDLDMAAYAGSGCAILLQRRTHEGQGAMGLGPIVAAYAIDPPAKR